MVVFLWSNIGPTLVVPSIPLSWESKAVDLVSADHPVLGVAQVLDAPLFEDLSGLLLAILGVPVLLSFLGMRLHLEPLDLLSFFPWTLLPGFSIHYHLVLFVVLEDLAYVYLHYSEHKRQCLHQNENRAISILLCEVKYVLPQHSHLKK